MEITVLAESVKSKRGGNQKSNPYDSISLSVYWGTYVTIVRNGL